MARALRIAGLVLAALLIVAIGAWLLLFATPPGRTIVKGALESQLGAATGRTARIGRLGGAPPGKIVLEDISFSDDGENWLRVGELTIEWRPFALARGRIDAELLAIEDAVLLNAPPKKEQAPKPRGFTLPDTLPQLRIGEIRISNFQIDKSLAGEEARIDGEGVVEMGGKRLDIDLRLAAADARDVAKFIAKRSGDELSIDLAVTSAADGALAAIANLDGPLQIRAAGSGALEAYQVDFSAALGALAGINGHARTDFTALNEIHIAADAALGARLQNTAKIIGTHISFDGAFRPADKGADLIISDFSSDVGKIEGSLAWRNRNDALDTVTVKASAMLAQSWRPDLSRYIGRTISVDGVVKPKGTDYAVTAAIEAEYFNAALNAIETDLREFARGPVSIELLPNEALPGLLAKGGEVAGKVALIFAEGISAETTTLITPQGAAYNGDAAYRFDDQSFVVDGEFRAPPKMLSALNEKIAARSPAIAAVSIRGAADDFGGTVKAQLPALSYGGEPLPPARLDIDFEGAPSAPAGKIAARTTDGSRKLAALFDRGESGAIRLNDIDYVGDAFALKGSAALAIKDGKIALDLVYRGKEGAEPIPGTMLEGDFTAKGSLSRGAAKNRLQVDAGALKSDGWRVANLKASAEGPSDRLSVKATADYLTVRGLAPINNLSTDVTAALRDNVVIRIAKFSAETAGAPIALTSPAMISVSNGVEIEGVRASIGREGTLALDGALSPKRWRAKLTASHAPIVSAASALDLDLDLDTARETPASGRFTLTSLLTRTDTATLSGIFDWNGKTLSVRDAGNAENFDLSLSLPMALSKSPAMSLAIEGPLKGEALYAGRLETVAGFLPTALQSLEGDLSLQGAVTGTLDNPKMTGTVKISDAAFTELNSGVSIVKIDGSAHAESAPAGSRIVFKAAGAGPKQEEKTVFAEGEVSLARQSRIDAKFRLANAKLSGGPVTEVDATGEVGLSGPFSRLKAKGEINVKSLNAQVFTPESTGLVPIKVVAVDQNGKAIDAEVAKASETTIFYDLSVKANDRIFIRGRGLESEWRADIDIDGEGAAPVIVGSMTMRDGVLTFAGRRFELTKGRVAFDRLAVNNPTLEISAERETASGTTATILIEGRARSPKITLSSSPPLPQEDIMALVLFDKPASELSAFESLQVAQGLAQLGGIGPFGGSGGGLTGSARQALGLDLLNLDIDERDASASSLTVGKYVADGLFVSATQDARGENGAVRIEYEINNSFTVETELRQDGDQKVSGNWKHDF